MSTEVSKEMIGHMSPSEMYSLPNVGLRFIIDEHQSQTSAFVLLQWCLDPEFSRHLIAEGAEDPMLIISVIAPNGDEDRRVVDLSDWQVLVPFHRSGTHMIRGRIHLVPKEMKKEMRARFLKKSDRHEYNFSFGQIKTMGNGLGNAQLKIDVPKEFFAKELSAWESWWLQLWLGEMWDECSIRRRRAFAYLIQGPLVLAYMSVNCTLRFLIAVFLGGILWQRAINWEAVIHPYEYSFGEVWARRDYISRDHRDRAIGSFVRYDSKGRKNPVSMHFLWIFFPPIHIALIGCAAFVAHASKEDFLDVLAVIYGTLFFYPVMTGVSAVVILWGAFVLLRSLRHINMIGVIMEKSEKYLAEKQIGQAIQDKRDSFILWLATSFGYIGEQYDRKKRERLELMLKEVSCESAPQAGLRPISAMPLGPRTMSLAYQNIKAMVCKPVARG